VRTVRAPLMVGHWPGLTRPTATTGAVTGTPTSKTKVSGSIVKWCVNQGPAGVMPWAATAALTSLGSQQILQDLNASVRYLETRPLVAKTRIGAIGFGMGGNVIWLVLTTNTDVKAAVAISGVVPSPRVVSTLTAGVLAIFGENDRRDDQGIAEFDTAMKNAGLPFAVKLEPKAGRDFFDDTTTRYVPLAAKDAWRMTLDWLSQHLTG